MIITDYSRDIDAEIVEMMIMPIKPYTVVCRIHGIIATCDSKHSTYFYVTRHRAFNDDCNTDDIGVINNYDTTNTYIDRGAR